MAMIEETTNLTTFKDLWDYFQEDEDGNTRLKNIYKEYINDLGTVIGKDSVYTNKLISILDVIWKWIGNVIPSLYNFNLLYYDNFSITTFKSIVIDEIQPLISGVYSYINSIDPKFLSYENLSDITTNSVKQNTSYTGFDVSNQDGSYNNISVDNETKSTNQLGFLEYLRDIYISFNDNIIRRFKRELCVIIM